VHLLPAPGVDARRRQLNLHPHEILEAMEHAGPAEDAGNSDYGWLVRVTESRGPFAPSSSPLPMTIVAIEARCLTCVARFY
jgi:hypothetical protein